MAFNGPIHVLPANNVSLKLPVDAALTDYAVQSTGFSTRPDLGFQMAQLLETGALSFTVLPPYLQAMIVDHDGVISVPRTEEVLHELSEWAGMSLDRLEQTLDVVDEKTAALTTQVAVEQTHAERPVSSESDDAPAAFGKALKDRLQLLAINTLQQRLERMIALGVGQMLTEPVQRQAFVRTYGLERVSAEEVKHAVVEKTAIGIKDAVLAGVAIGQAVEQRTQEGLELNETDRAVLLLMERYRSAKAYLGGGFLAALFMQGEFDSLVTNVASAMIISHQNSTTPVASAVLSEADALQKAGVKSVGQLTVKLANQTVQNAQATGLMSASQLIALRRTYQRLVARAASHEAEREHATS